jgi:hypothetical protein
LTINSKVDSYLDFVREKITHTDKNDLFLHNMHNPSIEWGKRGNEYCDFALQLKCNSECNWIIKKMSGVLIEMNVNYVYVSNNFFFIQLNYSIMVIFVYIELIVLYTIVSRVPQSLTWVVSCETEREGDFETSFYLLIGMI